MKLGVRPDMNRIPSAQPIPEVSDSIHAGAQRAYLAGIGRASRSGRISNARAWEISCVLYRGPAASPASLDPSCREGRLKSSTFPLNEVFELIDSEFLIADFAFNEVAD